MSNTFKQTLRRKREGIRRRLKKAALVPSKLPTDNWTNETREKLVFKVNQAEQHIDALLRSLPLTFKRERPIVANGKRYFIDFLVISLMENGRQRVRVAIEVDGGYHNTSEQRAKDKEKDRNLLTSYRVWSILRIPADVAITMDETGLYAAIKRAELGITAHVTD